MKKKNQAMYVFFSAFLLLGVFPASTHAASSSWTASTLPALYGYRHSGFAGLPGFGGMCPQIPCTIDPDSHKAITVPAWVTAGALNSPAVQINHSATIRDNTTSVSGDAPAVHVGDSISFLPAANSGTDISWNSSGFGIDTPYGNWSSSNTVTACDASTQIGTNQMGSGYYSATYAGYVSLNITPSSPTISKSGTATLSCDTSGFNCTVTGAGSINATITWPATTGSFAYAYTKVGSNDVLHGFYLPTGTCVDAGPMSTSDGAYYSSTYPYPLINNTQPVPYVLPVPAQNISFNLAVTASPSVNVYFGLLDTLKSLLSSMFAPKAFAEGSGIRN